MAPSLHLGVMSMRLRGLLGVKQDERGAWRRTVEAALAEHPGTTLTDFSLQPDRESGAASAWRLSWLDRSADEALLLHAHLAQALTNKGVAISPPEAVSPPGAMPSPGPEADLCIEATSPLVLWCERQALDIHALYTMLRARLRRLGGRTCKTMSAALAAEEETLAKRFPEARLLAHLARHWPPQAVNAPPVDTDWPPTPTPPAGLGRHGHLRGALFLRRPPPALLAALQALQALNGLALARRNKTEALVTEGAYRLRWQQAPWLDQAVLHRRRLLSQARLLCQSQNSPTLTDELGQLLTPEQATERLLQYARQKTWAWEPNLMHQIPRPDHAPRPIEVLSPLQSLWQRHLLAVLSRAWEPLLASNSYGFRASFGVHAAVAAVGQALTEGYTHVLRTDITQCFDSVSHPLMISAIEAVLPQCDHITRAALASLLTQPHVLAQELCARSQGLIQGAPLSPLLLNLFLTPLDRKLQALPVFSLRYADDILVLARSRTQAQQALAVIQQTNAPLQLRLSAHKTEIRHVQQGFQFLGHRFEDHHLETPAAATPAQRKPLIISWPWMQLGVNGASLEAKREGQVIGRWPLRRLSAIVLLSPANLSTTLIERCLKQDVTLGLTLQSGQQHLVMPPQGRHSYELAHQHALWHAAMPPQQRLLVAHSLVEAKLHNTATLVAQRTPRSPLRAQLVDLQQQLARASDLNTLRGYEGYAARLSFKWLNEQVREDQRQHFTAARRARGAPDRLNSMLNLGYYFLAARLRVWLRLQALNPYLAWLHEAEDPYETLVYDLMEPFRPFVDRLVLRSINRQEVRADHFAKEPGQHRMQPQAAARFAQAFEAALGERVGPHLLRDLIWLQARAVRSAVQHQGSLWVFRWQARASNDSTTPAAEPLLWMAEQGDGWSDPPDPEPNSGQMQAPPP